MAKARKSDKEEIKKACEKAGNIKHRKLNSNKHSQTTSTSFLRDFSVTVSPVRR